MSDDKDFPDHCEKHRQKQHCGYEPDWEDDEGCSFGRRKPAFELSGVGLPPPPAVVDCDGRDRAQQDQSQEKHQKPCRRVLVQREYPTAHRNRRQHEEKQRHAEQIAKGEQNTTGPSLARNQKHNWGRWANGIWESAQRASLWTQISQLLDRARRSSDNCGISMASLLF
jgi:hypothetical protein